MSTSHSDHAPASAAPSGASSGFKYFVPGLIVGFVIGAVVGVLLPEFADRGGPRLQAPAGSGQPRVHDEEAKMNESQLPQETTPDSSGTTAPDSTPPAPAAPSGH